MFHKFNTYFCGSYLTVNEMKFDYVISFKYVFILYYEKILRKTPYKSPIFRYFFR